MEISLADYRRLCDQAAIGATEEQRQRFWDKVEKSETCWLFPDVGSRGYGKFFFCGRTYGAHRISLLWSIGQPAPEKMACHLCRNRNCVKPEHLYFGTAQTNADDRTADGTSLSGEAHPMATITQETADKVRQLILEKGVSSGKIAHKLGVAKHIVKAIVSGKTWNDGSAKVARGLKGIKKHYGLSGHPQSVLNERDVLMIRRELHSGAKLSDCAAKWKVGTSQISHIKTRRSWGHLPDEQQGTVQRKRNRKHLSDAEVAQIKKELRETGGGYGVGARLAREYGTSSTVINYIKQGKTFVHVEAAL